MDDTSVPTGWNFDNSYLQLPKQLYTKQAPANFPAPKLMILNEPLAKSLGLNIDSLASVDGAAVLAGNIQPQGAASIAQAYAGHQFGHFTMLGDGRASLIGEQITPEGERFDLQLKGSGKTLYSRGGDGLAALGPMLREYIISEGLYQLGIPTTRSLAVVTTGEKVMREEALTGAVLTRVASSHIRVGTFQFIASYGNRDALGLLADYTIKRHYPEILGDENKYLGLLQQVVKKQAKLIAKWQLVGFVHGVMNTDNMTVSGESIDFGPCAFMDNYDPKTVFSSIDNYGRYAYNNQPDMAAWNLSRFADALLPLISKDQKQAIKLATEQVSDFYILYDRFWLHGMRSKLGLVGEEQGDEALVHELLHIMEKYQADYTNTFRSLTMDESSEQDLFQREEFKYWKEKWARRLDKQNITKAEVKQLMKEHNPSVILRNHRVEEALEAAVANGDMSVMKQLLSALEDPYVYRSEQETYAGVAPNHCHPYKTFCGT